MVNPITISKIVLGAAHVCDFITVVSLGTNIFALFKKRAYRLAVADGDLNIKNSHYYTYLKSKPPIRCLCLMIPGFNFFFAIYYAYKDNKTVIAPMRLNAAATINLGEQSQASDNPVTKPKEPTIVLSFLDHLFSIIFFYAIKLF